MKVVKYIGGLGNQMFIYAFSLALQHKYGEEIFADLSYYNRHSFHNGFELGHIFGISPKEITTKDRWKLSWYIPNYYLDYHLRRFISSGPRTYYEHFGEGRDEKVFSYGDKSRLFYGFWQDYRYFHDIKDEVVKAFTFKELSGARNIAVMDEILRCNSVGIHIRRGDYLSHPLYKGICDLNYYHDAIDRIKESVDKPAFFIFSNDIEWCRDNIGNVMSDYPVTYVDWNTGRESYIDMQLMSKCKSLIIANSSFSWWAAYLNVCAKLIVAPSKWINQSMEYEFTPENWTKV